MSYTRERDHFVARMATEGLPVDAIHTLLRAATTLQRLAELACSSEAADRDRVRCPAWSKYGRYVVDMKQGDLRHPCLCDHDTDQGRDGEPAEVHTKIPRITIQDWQAERRAERAVPAGWRVLTQGDPRGAVLAVIPASYAARNEGKDRHNLDSIGVPARPSRLVF